MTDQSVGKCTQLQLIDVNGVFSLGARAWIQKEKLEGKGYDFSVVTVLGCQSSGKSTLLNELFGTTFQVMDATLGSSQTTQGLWLSKDVIGKEATLIIDVEGTDSTERGEDGQKFERRAALFCLALADVVFINIWHTDLGRYKGSNYELLKTVMGVNLELFQQQKAAPKTIILFVIRDYNKITPLEIVMKKLRDNISSIWKEMPKPEHLKISAPEDFFVLKTVGLPSFFSEPEAFRAEAAKLRAMLRRDCRPESYSRRIPADGFAYYAKSVWDTIMNCSDLNIPSQKEMLAIHRCEELKNAAREKACEKFSVFISEARAGTLVRRNFAWAAEAVGKALGMYDPAACRYQENVFLQKRSQLLQSLRAEIQKVVDVLLLHTRQSVLDESREALNLICASEDAPRKKRLASWVAFNDAGSRVIQESQRSFHRIIASLSLEYQSKEDGSKRVMKFESNGTDQSLKESLEIALVRVRERELREFQKVVSEMAIEALGNIARHWASEELTLKGFWAEVSSDVSRAIEDLSEDAEEAFLGLQSSEDATRAKWNTLVARIVMDRLLAVIQSICDSLHVHMCARFQMFFVQKGQSLSSDEFEKAYTRARECAFVLPQLFRKVEITCPEVASDPVLIKQMSTRKLLTEDKEKDEVEKAEEKMLEYKEMVKSGVVTTSVWEYFLLGAAAVAPFLPLLL